MPNHITNILSVTGPADEVERFRKAVDTRNGSRPDLNYLETSEDSTGKIVIKDYVGDVLDFNGTLAMPEDLHGTVSSSVLEDKEKQRQARNLEKYGAGNWYDWANDKWGTRGAYDVAPEPEPIQSGLKYRFTTAWSVAVPWFRKTAEMFPALRFEDAWQDEGGGSGIYAVWTEDEAVQETEESMKDHEWCMQYDPDYRDRYLFITDGDYDKVIKDALENGTEYRFEEALIARIKPKDLALFVSHEWEMDESTEAYNARLKEQVPEKPVHASKGHPVKVKSGRKIQWEPTTEET